MEDVISLIIPFIALAILSVMIDRFTLFLEAVVKYIPLLPNRFEWPFAYGIVLGTGYLVCWQGHFDLFAYLAIHFRQEWQGWLMTALVISGGSAFVRTSFSVIDNIPMSVQGAYSSVKRMILPSAGSDKGGDQGNGPTI